MYKSIGGNQQEENMSNLTCATSGEASTVTSCNRNDTMYLQPVKKKRNQPGHPEPGAEVIALSPRSLLATNRFVCEVCNKGFQRDQNLQLHRRGHNLPWKLKQRSNKEVRKKVYICPEVSCVHHDASRALGDLTGIKKHFFRKHGEKKWKCDKCTKKYAVQSDWKAHSKICGTREYRCDCGTVFSRRDSFITHRAFCDALAQENGRSITRNNLPSQSANSNQSQFNNNNTPSQNFPFQMKKEQPNFISTPPWLSFGQHNLSPLNLTNPTPSFNIFQDFNPTQEFSNPNPNPRNLGPTTFPPPSPYVSATALLQKAAQMGSKCSTPHQFPSPSGEFITPHQGHVSGFVPSREDQLVHNLALYGGGANKTVGAVTADGGHEMMMMMMNNAAAGFDSSPFEDDNDDVAFAEMLNSGRRRDFRAPNVAVGEFSNEGENKKKNMTRDFLGLRPLSRSEILSISGFDNCINSAN